MLTLWLIIWQIAYLLMGKEVLIPSPFHTAKALFMLLQQIDTYQHILYTLLRIMTGMMISLILAILTAVLSYFSEWFKCFIGMAVTFMKATPVMAIVILAILWFRSDEVPIFVCFLMCYPIIYTNVLAGFFEMDEQLTIMSKIFKVPKKEQIFKCYLPQLRPYLCAAIDLGIGMAFKVVIAAEVLAIPKNAIGYQLLEAKIYLETQKVFAWLIIIIFLSHVISKGIHKLLRMRSYND